MISIKNTFFLLLLSLSPLLLAAQSADTASHHIHGKHRPHEPFNADYSERGFFQKAYTDKGDPRFMVADENDNFRFGIGGVIHATAFYDFNGSLDDNSFTTWNIPVPTDFSGQFGLSMASSKLNFKAIGKLGKRDVVAFFELGVGSSGNAINLRHAYFSYGGLTIGHTYSFFMDLAAGPMTVDLEGPNTQISKRHPLVGYTHSFNDHWLAAAAFEAQALGDISSADFGIGDAFQQFPDITVRASYKASWGHLQVASMFRTLYYYNFGKASMFSNSNLSSTSKASSYNDGFGAPRMLGEGTHNRMGFGLALSGCFNFTPCTSMFFQGVGGWGIASYIQDLSNARLDLVRITDLDSNFYLNTAPMYGCYLALQHRWSPSLLSSLVYGSVFLRHYDDYFYHFNDCGDFLSSHYFAANFFWNVNDYFVLGIEYLYGLRVNQDFNDNTSFGHANRIDMMLTYSF